MQIGLLFQLFIAFARANLLGYGGGPSTIPLIEAEVVHTYGWMNPDQFATALAIGNSLPGPIATKLAAFVGYQKAGALGATSALLGTVLPSAILMVALVVLLARYNDHPAVAGMIRAVKAVVFTLFVLMAVDFFRFAWPATAGWLPAVLAAGSFVAIYFFKVHQALAVLGALLIGAIALR